MTFAQIWLASLVIVKFAGLWVKVGGLNDWTKNAAATWTIIFVVLAIQATTLWALLSVDAWRQLP